MTPHQPPFPATLKTGTSSSPAGQLAGDASLRVTGPLPHNPAARAASTHDKPRRAPQSQDTTPSFHCPEYPECGCPGGTVRPECPGLKVRRGRDGQWMLPVFAMTLVIWLVVAIVLALATLP